MTIHYGYVSVPHGSYDEWRNTINGDGWDADGVYGCQCYDLALLFWYNVGFPPGIYPTSTPYGYAYGIWTDRNNNISYGGTTYFELIPNLQDVKRGDVIIYDAFSGNPFGHVGFADEDYDSWSASHPGDYEFPILSENNGGTPDPSGGAYANIHGYNTRLFLGAFRYKEWEGPEPEPVVTKKKKHFPWPVAWNHWGGFYREI